MPTLLNRREWLTTAAMGVAAAVPRERPNVLFISIDDLNDWVGML